MKPIHAFVSAGAVAVAVLLPVTSRAESGTVEILLSSVSIPSTVQMGDTAITVRSGTGTITVTKSSGDPFLEGLSGPAQYASYSKKSPTGFDLESDGLATFAPDDTLQLLFRRKSGDLAAGTTGEGVLTFPGGTGRFARISGQCKNTVTNLANNWNVTTAKCRWCR